MRYCQGYTPRGIYRKPLASPFEATERKPAKDRQSKVRYREADYIVQNLKQTNYGRIKHRNRPLTMDSGTMLGVSEAFSQIDVATQALENARDTISKLPANDLPKKTLTLRLNAIGVFTKKMMLLAEDAGREDEGSTSQSCDHARDLGDRATLSYVARAVAKDNHPEQEARIREYLSRT